MLVKVLLAESLQLHGALLQSQVLLVRVLGHLGRHVVADHGVQARHQHQTGTVSSVLHIVERKKKKKNWGNTSRGEEC